MICQSKEFRCFCLEEKCLEERKERIAKAKKCSNSLLISNLCPALERSLAFHVLSLVSSSENIVTVKTTPAFFDLYRRLLAISIRSAEHSVFSDLKSRFDINS